MTNSFSLQAVVRHFSMLLVASVALAAGSLVTFAQCSSPCPLPRAQDPNATNQYAFPQGTVYVDIDVTVRGTDEGRQIIAGLQSWNQQNQNNGSGVYFDTTTDPWTVPGQINIVHILNTTLTNPDGSVNTRTVGRTVFNRVDSASNTAYDVTIFFNTGGALSNPDDPNSGPFYDSRLPGYDSIFQKETEHETGHGMGLSDVDPNCQQSGQSVMNHSVYPNCANDSCGAKPLTVSDCDSNAVSQVPNYQPPPVLYQRDYQSGGGDQTPFYYYGDSCTPYYWVWYESYDGGKTWYETGQTEYAGCW